MTALDLDAAAGGDEAAFRRLFEPYRAELHAHCYRMLGSVHDAEDALQEASLRAWRGLAGFERRSSLRSWLYTIATNACLDVHRAAAEARAPGRLRPGERPARRAGRAARRDRLDRAVPESAASRTAMPRPRRYEQREGVELAFIAALQHLPATQRAVLILREVLGFSAREAAEALDTTVAGVNSALQRARKAIDERLPERTQQATLRALGDSRLRVIVETLHGRDAARRRRHRRRHAGRGRGVGDAAAGELVPRRRPARVPAPRAAVGRLALAPPRDRANGQPAIGAYTWDEGERAFLPFALDVITLDGDRIATVTAFIVRDAGPEDREYYARWPEQPLDAARVTAVFERCGLPARLGDEFPGRGGS